MPLGVNEWKKHNLYEMVKPKIEIKLFKTYLYNLSLVTFQPIYIPK
jgi:hypothetical protein